MSAAPPHDGEQGETGGEKSVNTVKTHLNNVYRKLGTSSRDQALVKARQLGLLP
jgi:hypothetical protein